MEELWKDSNIFYNVLCFLITENEKLFDRNDAVLYWRTVYHFFGILHHVYIGLFAMGMKIESHPNPDIRVLYTLGPGYLTGWNFTFQTIFLGLSLLHDVLEWFDKQKSNLGSKIKYWRDVIFCGMVLPFTLFVTGMFWTVYAIDRELVFPKIYDEVVPWWFNHCVHTNITVVLVVETLLQARRHPTNQRLELILYWIVAFAYAIVYYTIYFVTDRWLYQVFGVMNWWQVCLYQLFIWGISYFFYKMQFPLNRLIHGSDPQPDNNEEKHINDVLHDNDRQTDVLNPDETGKVNADLETSLPEKSWSMKFRNIKNNVENSRL
ncbi:androgen-dependent TFPI-regulating protein-like isoform X2 [Maniola hyperantus]|uniref:androgen-dependent TFPI-regulating protein-like isoform X2 n=1 Tax=Aphantopus hyperantus TaxID=2795564 RepID=UPI001569FDE9|nr:androgen-dependent TFPI-regulating protein-like isoform X1 [Maniola hyperantus]XP_034838699.1 androgen-dependent TFPI-regulating protein-like isoform X1 [Maniola hyperantus]